MRDRSRSLLRLNGSRHGQSLVRVSCRCLAMSLEARLRVTSRQHRAARCKTTTAHGTVAARLNTPSAVPSLARGSASPARGWSPDGLAVGSVSVGPDAACPAQCDHRCRLHRLVAATRARPRARCRGSGGWEPTVARACFCVVICIDVIHLQHNLALWFAAGQRSAGGLMEPVAGTCQAGGTP